MIFGHLVEDVKIPEQVINAVTKKIKVFKEKQCPKIYRKCKYQQRNPDRFTFCPMDPYGTGITYYRCKEKEDNILVIPAHIKIIAGYQ